MADVKICGINSVEALDAAIDGGARFVGFVTYPRSPRFLGLDKLAALAGRARGRVETVLVTVNADDGHLVAATGAARPDWIQLHGHESVQRAAEIRPIDTSPPARPLPAVPRDSVAPQRPTGVSRGITW